MRKWLLPFSLVYGFGSWLRNKIYDLQLRKSVEFELPVISVGNLSVGGTGKTPQVEYLIALLKNHFKVGVLSRGYGRKTKGFFSVELNSTSDQTGDEPLQIKRKFPDVFVAVCEERAIGIPIMLLEDSNFQVIILDDAFQHRQVNPGFSILLTEYSKPFTRDQLLPAGNLRESSANAGRADVIIFTKSPREIPTDERSKLLHEITRGKDQEVLFSFLEYDQPYELFNPQKKLDLSSVDKAILITGIASNKYLLEELRGKTQIVHHFNFRDHHRYSLREVNEMIEQSKKITGRKIILTTEKDGVRLLKFRDQFINNRVEIYCVPVRAEFAAEKEKFDAMILQFVENKIQENRND